MGKTIDEITKQLTDQPIETSLDDYRSSEAYQFIQAIDDLLATGQYTWAEQTLTDIQTTVEKLGRVTEGQRRAVKNIEEGIAKRYRSWGGRWK